MGGNQQVKRAKPNTDRSPGSPSPRPEIGLTQAGITPLSGWVLAELFFGGLKQSRGAPASGGAGTGSRQAHMTPAAPLRARFQGGVGSGRDEQFYVYFNCVRPLNSQQRSSGRRGRNCLCTML